MLERNHISFTASVILLHNQEFLDCIDTSPDELRQLVDQHSDVIRHRIDKLYTMSREKARRPETKVAPSILIARLALRGSEKEAFTVSAAQNLKRVYTTPEALSNIAQRYWDQIEQTEFQPEVYTRLAPNILPGTFGTWLAVRLPS